jgi:hypothetical protein
LPTLALRTEQAIAQARGQGAPLELIFLIILGIVQQDPADRIRLVD